MQNILVCYKWILNEQEIKIDPNTLSLDTSRAKKRISEYDKNAIELAAQIVEAQGGSSIAISYGGADVKQSLKDALARGPERAIWVNDPNSDKADAYVTANALAAAVRQAGDYSMILCADTSADASNQQVPLRLAVLLGIPAITCVIKLDVEGEKVIATRRVGDTTEKISVEGPAVFTVLPEIAQPRFPTVKQVLAAGRKPQLELKVDDLGLESEKLTPKRTLREIKGYTMSRKNIVYKEGTPAEIAAQLVNNLIKEGVI
ncbi:MAG: Electron transfer flavoprotein alpha/beta-subunit [Firmicutes bacterium]|nr:Electron transfer flavoprotein alpha/beta-subunit [Bacillota bacterium]